ncbi:MAG: DNA repair protein RecN [Candidatus Binatus sp.]|uniref:DNA repair protein RecN n=1 Tax=Candidatus Binatus sp. TaxID=2811406 RepID=UPI00271AA4B9|nr:DNA repair protein RecN [Candidatus Binatus sp.]MDO8434940.1 DNA repair protein RecN [Candidatus Binatus sp.]
MLLELRIRNFAIIEEAHLEFGPGLNVLSGETGAGKTIILNALGLLLGARAAPDMVRSGEKEAVVEGLFELEGETALPELAERPTDSDSRELILRRTVADGGRSRAMFDGQLATAQNLAKAGAVLVQIYGQHEQQSLLRAESHREILDRFIGLETPLASYRELYDRAREIHSRLDDLNRRERERAGLLDLARFRLNELERAALVAGEDEALTRERTVLANATRLAAAATEAEQLLYGADAAAIDRVASAEARLTDAALLDPKLAEVTEMIASARANLEEAARALGAYASKLEADPARLDEIENRLQELSRLKRKYGGSIATAVEALERSRLETAELENIGESKTQVETELKQTLDQLASESRKLSAMRKSGATDLGRKMETELKTLGMRSPRFEPRLATVAQDEAGFVHHGIAMGPAGIDTIEFHLSPNLGQPAMPLLRIASGGELSRVMLALKRLEAQRRGIATMIFDEVDAGIGGAVAQVVGRKLKQLSRFHQILCVTHLPQIAAFADRHFVVEKEERRGSTKSRVTMLAEPERTGEIARMLGGEASDKFRRAAKELLDLART